MPSPMVATATKIIELKLDEHGSPLPAFRVLPYLALRTLYVTLDSLCVSPNLHSPFH